MRKIGVVTVARSDYGIYRPVLSLFQQSPAIDLWLYVSGAHMSPKFGMTVDEIVADGFPIRGRVDMDRGEDTPLASALSLAQGVDGFARLFARERPDLLVVLGDRLEMLAAVNAALPFNIPIAHIHGGEVTTGAIDDVIRHGITKSSHLHFVATETYRRRVVQMGEEPWRVHVSGAPGLDNIRQMNLLDRASLEEELGISLLPAPLLVTFHPVTREPGSSRRQIETLLSALSSMERPLVFTYPNADAEHQEIVEAIEAFVADHDDAVAIAHLGTRAYFSLMHAAAAMVGNSSSGLIEAASFSLPVVDIGSRQSGRIRADNVLHVECRREAILAALRLAVTSQFRAGLYEMVNPYGDGHAAERILAVLRSTPLDQKLLIKKFHDLDWERFLYWSNDNRISTAFVDSALRSSVEQ